MQELIVGGDFQSPGIQGGFQIFDSYGSWTGNEIEVGQESLFFSGGDSSNLIVELDGNSGATSVVQQDFTVENNNQSATLSFDLGARNTSGGAADPVLVEVLDDSGNVIFTQTVTPTSAGSFDRFELEFTFGAAGDYSLRFTEQGPDNSLGTVLDNVSLMVCFGAGTGIQTPKGEVPVEDLKVGDLVSTIEGVPQPLKWIGSRKLGPLDLMLNPRMRPVLIRKGALGDGMPGADLVVSPQHRLLVRSKVAQRVLGDTEALVPAKKLTSLPGVEVIESWDAVEYFHFALEQHSVVMADQAYTESLYVGPEALKMLSPEAVEELKFLFPDLFEGQGVATPARPLHSGGKHIDRLCQRLIRNDKPVVDLGL